MEKPATDIYTFSARVKNGFTYVDKTDRLRPLVNLSNRAHDIQADAVDALCDRAPETFVDAAVEEVAS